MSGNPNVPLELRHFGKQSHREIECPGKPNVLDVNVARRPCWGDRCQCFLNEPERFLLMDEFDRYRADMNEKLLGSNHLGIKRFFALDTQAYEDGALDKRTKELLGLVASIVLRCDDCITYHIKQCANAGVTRPQFLDAFNVALVVGGSITIPHLRRAIDRLDQSITETNDEATPHTHQ
jgi:AhpD family alkylhydroperoxidase